jgi:hypothetical protein
LFFLILYEAAFFYKNKIFLRKNALKRSTDLTVYQQCSSIQVHYKQLFSEEYLENLAREHNFIKRNRKISALSFVKTMIFNEESHEHLSLLDLKCDLFEHADCHISQEAIHKRFTPEAVSFLKSLLAQLFSSKLNQYPGFDTSPFTSVCIKDSTKFHLPISYTDSYPSYGSYNKQSALMNIQYEFDLQSGNWFSLDLTKATRNDQMDSKETAKNIRKGSLNIRDLGYITIAYLKAVEKKKAYYLNRLPKIGVYQLIDKKYKPVDWKALDKKIKLNNLECFEIEVFLGVKEKIKTRLVLTPIPQEIANKRIRKAKQRGKRSKGYQLSKEYRIKAKYNIYITNVPKELLSAPAIIKTYRLRWQIELIFKTWKSNLDLNKIKAMKKERMECQLIAKLIWILINSKLFQVANYVIKRSNPVKGCSPVKFFKRAKRFSQTLRYALDSRNTLINWFNNSIIPIIPYLVIEKRLTKPTHCQLLNEILIPLS